MPFIFHFTYNVYILLTVNIFSMGLVVHPDIQDPDTNAAQPLASRSDSHRLSIVRSQGLSCLRWWSGSPWPWIPHVPACTVPGSQSCPAPWWLWVAREVAHDSCSWQLRTGRAESCLYASLNTVRSNPESTATSELEVSGMVLLLWILVNFMPRFSEISGNKFAFWKKKLILCQNGS